MTADREPSSGPSRHPRARLTEARKRTFLRVLSETGSVPAAARAASPHSKGLRAASSTFHQERARNPEFAQAWAEAEEAALARVEAEIMRRAMTPTRRPVFSKGELVGHTEEYDNRLLVTLARRLNPEAWSERSRVEHSGTVEHQHAHRHTVVSLSADDLWLLPDDRRDALLGLLGELADAREAADRLALPNPGEHDGNI